MLFGKKNEVDLLEKDDIQSESEPLVKKIRTRVKKEKEPIKPWGMFERMFVLVTLFLTVGISGVLALSARNFKLPNLPKLVLNDFDLSQLNIFREQTITIGNKGSKVDLAKIEETKKKFKEMTDSYSGIYAFYIYDLNGDYYYGVNHQEVMQAASLIKLPLMTTIYSESENGKIDLNEYKLLLEAMGKRSDNGAFRKALEMIGKDLVVRKISELGMTNTSLEENLTTPEEIGLFFKKLYKNEILNKENNDEFLNYLTDTIFENWIVAGIPTDTRVAHKYAREQRSVSDAGIIFSDKPFVMVIATDGVIEREADELIPKISNMLYTEQTK